MCWRSLTDSEKQYPVVFLFSCVDVTLLNVSCMKVYFPYNTSLFFFPSNLIIVHLGPEYA